MFLCEDCHRESSCTQAQFPMHSRSHGNCEKCHRTLACLDCSYRTPNTIRIQVESPIFDEPQQLDLPIRDNPIAMAIHLLDGAAGPLDAISIHYRDQSGAPEAVKYTVVRDA